MSRFVLVLALALVGCELNINVGTDDADVDAPPSLSVASVTCPPSVVVGLSDTCRVVIDNAGDEAVAFSDITLDGDPSFELVALPTEIAAGASATIEITIAPSSAATLLATLFVTSTEGTLSAALTVDGLATALTTTSSCGALLVQVGDVGRCAIGLANAGQRDVVLESATIDGGDGVFTLATMLAPGAVISPGAAATLEIIAAPAAVGDVAATLSIATNVGPLQLPLAVKGIVGTQLGVSLEWTSPTGDFDLHLVKIDEDGRFCANGAREAVEAEGEIATTCDAARDDDDCGFQNCRNDPRPDWDGSGGASAGDPVMDIDDIQGLGPESIRVDDLQPGRYLVGVHMFGAPDTDATANITIIYGGAVVNVTSLEWDAQQRAWWEAAVLTVTSASLVVDTP